MSRRFYCSGPCWELDCQCRKWHGMAEKMLPRRPPLHMGCTCYVAEDSVTHQRIAPKSGGNGDRQEKQRRGEGELHVMWIHAPDCPERGEILVDADRCTCGMPPYHVLSIARDAAIRKIRSGRRRGLWGLKTASDPKSR